MWLLAILLPVLIASTIPVSDPNWICFGTLLKILAICMCRKIDHRMIPILTELIKDHHEQFLVLYPGRMVPKYHFLVHFPDIIFRFGPPRSYWCMRFEAKNRFFKDVIHGNFKNIPYTLAFEHQLWLCHQLYSAKKKETFLYIGDEVKGDITVNFRTSALYTTLLMHLDMPLNTGLLLKCKYVRLSGIEYRRGAIVRLTDSSDTLPFYYASIADIYVYNSFKFFICLPYNTEHYDTHYNASIVSPNCVMTPQLIPCDKLYFPGVVSFHYTGDKHYVIDKDHPHHFC